MRFKHIIICGPTGSGKSALALRIAQKISGVIINADSQQIYKELPILSAQPPEEDKKLIPHHLYGVMSGAELCTVAKWLDLAMAKINRQKSILVGGTGLYFHALMNGLSPIPEPSAEIRRKVRDMEIEEVARLMGEEYDGNYQRMRRALEVKLSTDTSIKEWQKMKPEHPYKPSDFLILNVSVPRETIYQNINSRLLVQVEQGALDEVRELLKMDLDPELPIMKALGVPEFKNYFEGKMSLEDAITKAQQKIRNYAKRQMTWFRNQLPEHKIDFSPNPSDKELDEIILQQS
jgi:tRNA dimethylallyltransferase